MYNSKNIVICLDGTGNQIEENISNVLKFYRTVRKGINSHIKREHCVFYDQGVGTIGRQNTWGAHWQRTKAAFGLATGMGLDANVLRAYEFLIKHYSEGVGKRADGTDGLVQDRIYIVGYSRGAHTARVLAALIYYLGVLKPEQAQLAGSALTAYKRAREPEETDEGQLTLAEIVMFNRITQAPRPGVAFLGVWDTVSSVIVPRGGKLPSLSTEKLLGTRKNPGVEVFRHAMSIDEARYMFRLDRWDPNQPKKRKFEIPDGFAGTQDALEVWFPGYHGDVGGGNVRKGSGLSQFALCWMIREAMQHGLEFNTQMVDAVALGDTDALSGNEHEYPEPLPNAPVHSSKKTAWSILEYLPKRSRYKEWYGVGKRRSILGLYIPRWEPRTIKEADNIHWSAIAKRDEDEGYDPVNWPKSWNKIPFHGLPSKNWRPKEGDK